MQIISCKPTEDYFNVMGLNLCLLYFLQVYWCLTRRAETRETCTQHFFSALTSPSVSFFTFVVQSATSAVTHRPASQQVSVRLQYSHITTRQFFNVIYSLLFVPKKVTATSPLWTTQIRRQPQQCKHHQRCAQTFSQHLQGSVDSLFTIHAQN